jgi:hypothetical protein
VGGPRHDRINPAPHRLAVVILARGPRFERGRALHEAVALDAGEVITVERASVDVDALTREHPEVRFLLVRDEPGAGELINIAMAEAHGRHVLVLWSDMHVESASALARTVDEAERVDRLCLAPVLSGTDGGVVPSRSSPALQGSRFSVMHAAPARPQCATLYPFDYCGVYRKGLFSALGGYDRDIPSPYWQKLDLGLRAHLFGQGLCVHHELEVSYRGDIVPEDTTPDPSYRRFYLRNVAVRCGVEGAYLPVSRLFPFLLRAGTAPANAVAEFRAARRWVRAHRQSYRSDVRELVALWQ